MALLLSDSFALYSSTTAGIKLKGWTFSGPPTLAQAGRWGAGSYSLTMANTSNYISQTIAFSGTTTILGCAYSTPSSTTRVIASLTVNSTLIYLEHVSTTGGYNLRVRNVTNATTYFTSSTVYAISAYQYLELKIIWNTGGSGRVVLRVDNSVIYDSGATLTIVAANGSTTLTLGAPGGNSTTGSFTDVLFMDGSGTSFTDFQGDVRIEALRPTSDGGNSAWSLPNNTLLTSTNQARLTTDASGWVGLSGSPTLTRGTTSTVILDPNRFPSYLNITSSTSSFSIISSPSGTSGYPVTPGQTLGFGVWIACNSGVPTATVQARFYDSGGSQVGSDLTFGTLAFNGVAWSFQNPATSTVTVPATSATCAIIIAFTSNSPTYRFTGFVLSTNSTTPAYVDPTGAHYFESAEFDYDVDASYVKSDVLNTKESYAMSDMAGNGQILGVRPIVVARKETNGPARTIATMIRIGSTNYTNANNQTVPGSLAYTTFSDILTTSPATSTTWTKSEVNGAETGFEITQ